MSVSFFKLLLVIDFRCTAGNKPDASDAVPTGLSGIYLNTWHPVMCDGNFITKWNFCYYTKHLTDASRLNMTLAVWSFYEGSYVFHSRRFTRISIIHNHTLAKIFCVEHSLPREGYLPVSHDDIVGVVLPSVNPIPVIGSVGVVSPSVNPIPMIGSGETITDFLEYRSEQNLESIMYNSLTPTSAIMHVEAVIGKLSLRQ